MGTRIAFAAALSATALTPVQAYAQDEAAAAVLRELTALREEIARLNARVESLEQQLDEPPVVPGHGGEQSPSPSATIATSQGSEPEEVGSPISWKGAPEFKSSGGWSFKPRGRIQVDAGFTSSPDGTGREDGFGSEIRRARLGVEGEIPGGFGYKFEADFTGNEVDLTDAFLTYSDDGVILTAGQHNNFQSLEELTSSRFSSFIERAAFTDAFGFERKIGLSAQLSPGDILLQAGFFTENTGTVRAFNRSDWSLDGRAVYLPKIGETQIHLGGSVHYAKLEGLPIVRYRQRPLVHFTTNRFIDTGEFVADAEFGVGLETAIVRGRFHAAGEAYWQTAEQSFADSSPTFFGGYAEVGYFLTKGDSRGYKNGIFDRTRPASPLDKGGIGAIQINVRYDYLDLNSGSVTGGIQNAYIFSLVWTPTDYTRFMLNYGRLDYQDALYPLPDGDRSYGVDSFGMRAQVDF